MTESEIHALTLANRIVDRYINRKIAALRQDSYWLGTYLFQELENGNLSETERLEFISVIYAPVVTELTYWSGWLKEYSHVFDYSLR